MEQLCRKIVGFCKNSIDMKRALALMVTLMVVCSGAFAQNNSYRKHIVKWYEDLHSISARYGVPVSVIKQLNNLKEDTLTARQELLIPTSEASWPANMVESQEEQDKQQDNADEQEDNSRNLFPGRNAVTVAMPVNQISLGVMLPFTSGSAAQRNNVMDFYSGVLMAARELGESGMDIRINAIDYKKERAGMDNDMIIGPFRASDVEQALSEVDSNTIFVSPLDQKASALLENHPNLVQAAASSANQYSEALQYIKGDNYIVITSRSDAQAYQEIKDAMEANGISFKTCYCNVSGDIEGWDSAYSENLENVVILAINAEANLNNAIRNMGIANSKGNVQVYTGSKVTSYETIPVENLHRAELHVLCSYHVDYSDPATLEFIHQYRALYNTEPNQYAFQGHDLAYFLLNTYSRYGRGWRNVVPAQMQEDMIQSSFKLKKMENGSLVNVAGRKVEYQKNYKVQLVK